MRLILLIVSIVAFMPLNQNLAQNTENIDSEINTTPVTTVPQEEDLTELSQEEITNRVFEAIQVSDTKKLEPLLNALTYYKHNEAGETALTLAIEKNDVAMVEILVEDAVINLKNKQGETPLTLAIKKGNAEIIEMVSRRAKAALKNDAGEAPLFLALETDDLFLIQKLINKGADVNRKSNGTTPMAKAAELNKVRTIALLVKNGADPSQPNDNGDIPLYLAVKNNYDMVSGVLLHKSQEANIDANWTNQIGEPLINIAATSGSTQIVRTLLDHGANPNGMDMMENTALNIAAEQGDINTINLLLSYNADIDHTNIMGTTAIMAAARNGHTTVAAALAENGANPEVRDYSGIAANDFGDFEAQLIRIDQETEAIYNYNEPPSNDDKGNQ